MSELLDLTLKTLSEKLGEDITIVDLVGVNPFADAFVITTARNVRHAASLADEVIKEAQKNGFDVRTREGQEGSTWILVDLNDIIVQIFTEEARQQYKLENLWGDRPITYYSDKKDEA